MTAGRERLPFIKGVYQGGRDTLPGVRVRVIVVPAPPPFDSPRQDHGRRAAATPAHAGCAARSPSGTMEGTAGHGPRGDHRGSVFRRSCPGRSVRVAGPARCRPLPGLKMKRSNGLAGPGSPAIGSPSSPRTFLPRQWPHLFFPRVIPVLWGLGG